MRSSPVVTQGGDFGLANPLVEGRSCEDIGMGRVSEGGDERGARYWTRVGDERDWRGGESVSSSSTSMGEKNSLEEEEEKWFDNLIRSFDSVSDGGVTVSRYKARKKTER